MTDVNALTVCQSDQAQAGIAEHVSRGPFEVLFHLACVDRNAGVTLCSWGDHDMDAEAAIAAFHSAYVEAWREQGWVLRFVQADGNC